MKKISMLPLVWLILVIFIAGCTHSDKKISNLNDSTRTQKLDPINSIQINGYSVTPKATIKFDTIDKAGTDTLDLVICGDYVYDPFGPVYDKSQLSSSILRKFDIISRIDTMANDTIELQILKHGSSKMIFYFDHDSEASRHSCILKGEIYDRDIEFANGVKIGMSLRSFYGKIFSNFPDTLLKDFKVIILTSCVESIEHIYSFESDKLISVKFKTDTYWKVDY
jgi:hypothetical protein